MTPDREILMLYVAPVGLPLNDNPRSRNPTSSKRVCHLLGRKDRKFTDTRCPHHSSRCTVSSPTWKARSSSPPGRRTRAAKGGFRVASPLNDVMETVDRDKTLHAWQQPMETWVAWR